MKKTFKGILALFLALALLCAAVPAASAQARGYYGGTFDWDVSEGRMSINGDLMESYKHIDWFNVVPSEDVLANIGIQLYDTDKMYIKITNQDGDELFYTQRSTSVKLVMEANKSYKFDVYFLPGTTVFEEGSYAVNFNKIADFDVPEEPNGTGNGDGYLWSGRGNVTYATTFPQDVYFKTTRYYVAADSTFDLTFRAISYQLNPSIQIIINGPDGYSVQYNGSDINTTFTLEAGQCFYSTFGSSTPLPRGFSLNVTLTEV